MPLSADSEPLPAAASLPQKRCCDMSQREHRPKYLRTNSDSVSCCGSLDTGQREACDAKMINSVIDCVQLNGQGDPSNLGPPGATSLAACGPEVGDDAVDETDDSGINQLPESLLVDIFKLLSIPDLLHRVSLVSKYWYDIAHDPDLWRVINLRGQLKVDDQVLQRIVSYSEGVTAVDITDARLVSHDGLEALAKQCTGLQSLKLVRCMQLKEAAFMCLGEHCPALQALYLDCCLSLTDRSLVKIGAGCPQLKVLHINQCSHVTDEGIVAVARGCGGLRALSMDQCQKVQDQSLEYLAECCPNLEKLSCMKCNFTAIGISQLSRLRKLRVLEVHDIRTVTDDNVIDLVGHCPELQTLNLALCIYITDRAVDFIARRALNIQKLYLASCSLTNQALISLGAHSASIQVVDVGWCCRITDEGAVKISETCRSLRNLGLTRCDKVTIPTMEFLVEKYPHVHYSTFLLDCRRLMEQAQRLGYVSGGVEAPAVPPALRTVEVLTMSLALLIFPFIPATNLFFYVGFVVAERVLYMPSMGFCLLVAHGAHTLHRRHARRSRRAAVSLQVSLATLVLCYCARTCLRNQDWLTEENLYRAGISINPAKAWGNLANILNHQGKTLEAEEAYKAALKHRGNMADVHYNLGILLQEQKRYQEAIETYRMAIQCRPKLTMAHLNLGIVLTTLGQKQEAAQIYRHCADIDTAGLKDPRLHEQTKISALYNLGRLLADQDRYLEAVDVYKEAIASRPSHYAPQSLYNMLGEAYSKLERLDEAEHWYREALKAKTDHIPAHLTMGKLLHKKGLLQEAESWFQKAHQVAPDDSSVLQHYGQFLSESRRPQEAAERYLAAAALKPDDFELVFNTANALRQAGRNLEAETFYKTGVAIRPDEAAAHMNLGAMLHFNGNLDEAELSYQAALRLRPDDTITQANLKKLRNLMHKARKDGGAP